MPALDLSWPVLAAGAIFSYWLGGLIYWLLILSQCGQRLHLHDFPGLLGASLGWPLAWWDHRRGQRRLERERQETLERLQDGDLTMYDTLDSED